MNSNVQQEAAVAARQPLFLFAISGRVSGDDNDSFHLIAAEGIGTAQSEFERRMLEDELGENFEDVDDPENPEVFTIHSEKVGSFSGTSVLILDRKYRPIAPAASNPLLTAEQIDALEVLKVAMTAATGSGLFDELVGFCNSPESINDVCDAVTKLGP